MDLTTLDGQMGDLVWCFYNSLRASYNILQVLDILSREAPEPARSACKSLFDELYASVPGAEDIVNYDQARTYPWNIPMVEALERWKKAYPSPHIAKVADKILERQRFGGHLGDLLEPLEAEFISQSGSDPAFYPLMRQQEVEIGAPLPERAREKL